MTIDYEALERLSQKEFRIIWELSSGVVDRYSPEYVEFLKEYRRFFLSARPESQEDHLLLTVIGNGLELLEHMTEDASTLHSLMERDSEDV